MPKTEIQGPLDSRMKVASALGSENFLARDFAFPEVRLPWILTPGAPKQRGAYLDMFQAGMVLAEWPAATGVALFSSEWQSQLFPQVQVFFPRVDLGESYKVAYHVELIQKQTYEFRIVDFEYPGSSFFEDRSIPGGETHVISHIIAPRDDIPEGDEPFYFGSALMQRNAEADKAAWHFYSVHISPRSSE
jgi:hypothetical protein